MKITYRSILLSVFLLLTPLLGWGQDRIDEVSDGERFLQKGDSL
ncbi:hypothetical protein [Fodinibius sp. SL11]